MSPFAAPEIIRQFLSTPSARRATGVGKRHVGRINISIHALREEGDLLAEIVKPVELISIHALREEGDFFSAVLHPAQSDFYPRPPRGGRPEDAQGTSPLKYFYPRPPRGGRPDDDDIPF